jgi:hypothetical protein
MFISIGPLDERLFAVAAKVSVRQGMRSMMCQFVCFQGFEAFERFFTDIAQQ